MTKRLLLIIIILLIFCRQFYSQNIDVTKFNIIIDGELVNRKDSIGHLQGKHVRIISPYKKMIGKEVQVYKNDKLIEKYDVLGNDTINREINGIFIGKHIVFFNNGNPQLIWLYEKGKCIDITRYRRNGTEKWRKIPD